MGPMRGRAYGIGHVGVGSMLWSTAGLFVRLLAADGQLDLWVMLAWRSLFAATSLFLLVGFQHKGRSLQAIRAIGWPGFAAVPVSAITMFSYVAALKLTTVGNLLTIYATVPFVPAGLVFLLMCDKMQRPGLGVPIVVLVAPL